MADIDRITIEIGGREWPFKIGTLGMYRAQEIGGVDILAEFDGLRSAFSGSGVASPTKLLVVMSKVVWAGMLSYDDKITLEQVMDMMDVQAMTRLSDVIGKQMQAFMNGADAGEAPAPTRGKKAKG